MKLKIKNLRLRNLTYRWGAPTLLAIFLFVIGRPILAEQALEGELIRRFLAVGGEVIVGVAEQDGRQQVFYDFNGKKTFISNSDLDSYQPFTRGEYVIWISEVSGSGQVFMHHIPSEATTQLTFASTHDAPRVNDGLAVWQGWVDSAWQIFLFDGTTTRQVTSGIPALNPDVLGDRVIFARNLRGGQWQAYMYRRGSNIQEELVRGDSAKYPRFINDLLQFGIPKAADPITNSLHPIVPSINLALPTPGPEATPEPTPSVSLSVTPDVSPTPLPSVVPTPTPVTEKDVRQELADDPLLEPEATPTPIPESTPLLGPSPTPEAIPSPISQEIE